MTLKIYGERNTGTKFLREVLRTNGRPDLWPGTVAELGAWHRVAAADVPEVHPADRVLLREALIDDILAEAFDRTLGWKHGLPDRTQLAALGRDTTFLITVKNPYAWIVSMHRRPHHNLLAGNLASLETFITSPWVTCGRDNVAHRVSSIVELWNIKYRGWLGLQEEFDASLVRYEDLLLDSETLTRLGARLGGVTGWGLPVNVPDHDETLPGYKSIYGREGWRDALSPEHVALINARLDHEVVGRLGYTLLP